MSNPLRIAINGYGRIGRVVHRQALGHPNITIVAANSRTESATNAHLLKHDSLFGRLPYEVTHDDTSITANGQKMMNFNGTPGVDFSWKDLGVDIVLECTGAFRSTDKMKFHLDAGAKKVILSAPADDDTPTFVYGVNEHAYAGQDIISNASCTTNCTAPVAKVLHEAFGIERAMLSTIHSFTNDQNIHDAPHKDLRRARCMSPSIIPTKTGVAKALKTVLPDIAARFDGLSIRVPTPVVSLVDLVVEVSRETTVDEVNAALRAAAEGPMKNVLAYCTEPLVSIDFKSDPHSAIVDASETKVVGGKMVKVLAWYDNEWGYSARLLDMAELILK